MSNMPRAGADDAASAIDVPAATLRGPAMKIQLAGANQGDARLARTVAITFIAAMAILALSYGQDVLIPVAVAILFAQGWFFLPVQATTMTIVQQSTTDDIRGRVAGAVSSSTQTAMILSMAAAGLLSDTFGIRTVFQISGSIIAIGAVVAWLLFRSSVARPAEILEAPAVP
jgi:predicted MFS family arabinose efflux permease